METMSTVKSTPEPSQAVADVAEVIGQRIRPALFLHNSFRILGVSGEATLRDIERQIEKQEMLAEFGDTSATSSRRTLLDPTPAPDSEMRREARQRLSIPKRRLIEEFFWLWPLTSGSHATDAPLNALRDEGLDAAVDLWNREHGAARATARHNLAIVFTILALDADETQASTQRPSSVPPPLRPSSVPPPLRRSSTGSGDMAATYWTNAIAAWRELFDDEAHWRRVEQRCIEIDDPQLPQQFASVLRAALPGILLELHAGLAAEAAARGMITELRAHRERLAQYQCDAAETSAALGRAIEPIGDRVQQLCAQAAQKLQGNTAQGFALARQLLVDTRGSLQIIDSLLPSDHNALTHAHDEVALQSFTCMVTQANQDNSWVDAAKFVEEILPLAGSDSSRDKLRRNLEILQGNVAGDEEAKEVERLYGTCYYCGKNKSDTDSSYEAKLYGHVTRSGGIVNYRSRTIPVPRCPDCKTAHSRIKNIFLSILFCGIGIGVLIGFFGQISKGFGDALGGAFGGAILGLLWGGGAATAVTLCCWPFVLWGRKADTSIKKFPTIAEALREGWEIGEKPPNTQ